MITQDFVKELEMALYRSYGRANTKIKSRSEHQPNFVGDTTYKEEVVKVFTEVLLGRRPVLESEILKGGHQNTAEMFSKVSAMVENKIRATMTRSSLSNKGFDQSSFEKMVRDLKVEVRDVFYKGYLGS
ncbi:MAG: hypothetical protein Q8R47_02245 [Nanoarchaeota archaeon]|nr:hypothetical protein [Nanoarchaeota archaeon]